MDGSGSGGRLMRGGQNTEDVGYGKIGGLEEDWGRFCNA